MRHLEGYIHLPERAPTVPTAMVEYVVSSVIISTDVYTRNKLTKVKKATLIHTYMNYSIIYFATFMLDLRS